MAQPQKKRIILFPIPTLLSLVLLGACTPVPDATQVSFALRQSDGRQRWQLAVEGMNSSGPLINSGTIYIAITTTMHESMLVSHPAFVLAFQATTRKVLWQAQVGDGGDGRVLLAASRETIYMATEDGVLTALSAGNGTQQWHYQTNCRNDDSSTLPYDQIHSHTPLFLTAPVTGQ